MTELEKLQAEHILTLKEYIEKLKEEILLLNIKIKDTK